MSYILEALKKSQEERELGRVPTLDANLFPTRDEAARGHPWALVAVGLAMLAVIIALYAALRGQPLIEPQPASGVEAAATLEAAPLPAPEPQGAQVDAHGGARPGAAADPEGKLPETQAKMAAPSPGPSARAAAEPAPPPAPRRSSTDAAIPPRPQTTRVPEDLRADIEAFKDEVLGQERSTSRPAAPGPDVPPQALTLPREVAARLPAFLMTVHVYDVEPPERFVLINALKTREGEVSREGIRVEEILPDGAVLSYEGHRFFRPR